MSRTDSSWFFGGPHLVDFFDRMLGEASFNTVKATATGTASTAGTATGLPVDKATATGPTATAGTATGLHVVKATGTGSTATAGTATAKLLDLATASGTASTAGTSSGRVIVFGSAASATTTSGAATGPVVEPATAAGTASTAGTATGTVSHQTTQDDSGGAPGAYILGGPRYDSPQPKKKPKQAKPFQVPEWFKVQWRAEQNAKRATEDDLVLADLI